MCRCTHHVIMPVYLSLFNFLYLTRPGITYYCPQGVCIGLHLSVMYLRPQSAVLLIFSLLNTPKRYVSSSLGCQHVFALECYIPPSSSATFRIPERYILPSSECDPRHAPNQRDLIGPCASKYRDLIVLTAFTGKDPNNCLQVKRPTSCLLIFFHGYTCLGNLYLKMHNTYNSTENLEA